MSEYGLKITNFASGSVEEMANGVRDNYDCKGAMLTNSLFKDYMVGHGLTVWKEESTRDIICIDFSYGSRSYEEEVKQKFGNSRVSKAEETKANEKFEFSKTPDVSTLRTSNY